MRCFLESELRLVCKLAHYEHVIVIQLYATADRDGGIESRNFQFNVFITWSDDSPHFAAYSGWDIHSMEGIWKGSLIAEVNWIETLIINPF